MAFKEVGALWRKKTKTGEEYFSGQINAAGALMIFKNKRRTGSSSPDFIVTQPDDEGERFTGAKYRAPLPRDESGFIAPFATPEPLLG